MKDVVSLYKEGYSANAFAAYKKLYADSNYDFLAFANMMFTVYNLEPVVLHTTVPYFN